MAPPVAAQPVPAGRRHKLQQSGRGYDLFVEKYYAALRPSWAPVVRQTPYATPFLVGLQHLVRTLEGGAPLGRWLEALLDLPVEEGKARATGLHKSLGG